ncbi:hypothetical protein RCL1_008545 [Eukaryota sp. TZLM3-RCL]
MSIDFLTTVRSLFNNEENDFDVVVSNSSVAFKLHWFLLTLNSDFFSAINRTECQENSKGEVIVKLDWLNDSSFESVLRVLYGFPLEIDGQTNFLLYWRAADFFGINILKSQLEDHLRNRLTTVPNMSFLTTILETADQMGIYSVFSLIPKCIPPNATSSSLAQLAPIRVSAASLSVLATTSVERKDLYHWIISSLIDSVKVTQDQDERNDFMKILEGIPELEEAFKECVPESISELENLITIENTKLTQMFLKAYKHHALNRKTYNRAISKPRKLI